MAPFVGRSGVVMNLDPLVSGGLVRNGTLLEIDEGLSAEEVAEIVADRFGGKPVATRTPEERAEESTDEAEKPRGNASREAWEAYALSVGISEDDLKGLKQTEIRDLVDQKENPGDSEETGNTEEPADPKDTDPAGSVD